MTRDILLTYSFINGTCHCQHILHSLRGYTPYRPK